MFNYILLCSAIFCYLIAIFGHLLLILLIWLTWFLLFWDNLVHLDNLVMTILLNSVHFIYLDMFYYPKGKIIFHRN